MSERTEMQLPRSVSEGKAPPGPPREVTVGELTDLILDFRKRFPDPYQFVGIGGEWELLYSVCLHSEVMKDYADRHRSPERDEWRKRLKLELPRGWGDAVGGNLIHEQIYKCPLEPLKRAIALMWEPGNCVEFKINGNIDGYPYTETRKYLIAKS